ncbi:hypothetical protein [Ponticaulis koreensis]|uniref:hypothetical protein n=1 Tax=Ponticaulis koreensis TaxID=1123045 RepID=UPI0003B50505|nr:hypothetical protein [Ponticaulis koreensis]
MAGFDRDQFVADCINARSENDSMGAVREVLTRAISDPSVVLRGMGEPTQAGMDILHRSPTLTIFAATWTPRMNLLPHDHDMWALIGIYTGREDNIFWKETENGLQARGANCLFEGDVATLGRDAIHSVTNPLLRFTGGIHIYGGDYFDAHRHQWDPETLKKEPTNGDRVRAMFAAENERLKVQ